MAQSPSHKLGQIIGDFLESAIYEPLRAAADRHRLYLDYKHERPARIQVKSRMEGPSRQHARPGLRSELGGSEEEIGSPKAFIETAWRRYTKHSRNKAQEIQGAIGPLAETYSNCIPFLGVVLAGVFTGGSLQQLRSHGFAILFYPYEVIVQVFAEAGLDVAFDEDTPDKLVQRKVNACNALTPRQREILVGRLRDATGGVGRLFGAS